ncbi:MAG: DUF2782 domain-containing protein [Immundisolibacteraceae bacterium]|nr:DUF2782 domain-containing protein [Immundisolibacteraceae bacterium]
MIKQLFSMVAVFSLLAVMPLIGDVQAADGLLPPVTIDTSNDADDLRRRVVPNASSADEELEPQVVIRKSGENTIEEYRVNGQLYKVKITPAVGPAYFMIDTDGDGVMDQRYDRLGDQVITPQWVLFKW